MVNNVQVEHRIHNSRMKLFMKFDYDLQAIGLAKTIAGIKWSHTHKAWYIGYYDEALLMIKNTFEPQGVTLQITNGYDDIKVAEPIETKKPSDALPHLQVDAKNKIKEFSYWLKSKRYSESTVNTYTDSLQIFLRYFSGKNIHEINNDDLILFNNDYILANKFSSSYQNQIVNAVKLFFSTMEHKRLNPALVHRPKSAKLLPNVLSKEEIKEILNALSNIKHKAMLSLIYSCGLRRGELLNLKLLDIDSKRGLVIIRQAKGRKDRIAPLSEKVLALLRAYYVAYKPSYWLFEGQDKKSQYDGSSLSSVLKQALEKSRITKPVSLHWLRHSYATHLLENGTDLRFIQEILGHSRSTTTEIYTHVSNKNIQKIMSPFDSL